MTPPTLQLRPLNPAPSTTHHLRALAVETESEHSQVSGCARGRRKINVKVKQDVECCGGDADHLEVRVSGWRLGPLGGDRVEAAGLQPDWRHCPTFFFSFLFFLKNSNTKHIKAQGYRLATRKLATVCYIQARVSCVSSHTNVPTTIDGTLV